MVNDRCGGAFDQIDDVIPPQERAEYMAQYKTAAGFAVDRLNASDRTLPQGARLT